MAVALTLLWIGAGMILIGIVLAVLGIVLDRPVGPRPVTKPPFWQQLMALVQKCFKIITDPNSTRWMKLAALGMMLIFLGLAFLVGSAVAAAVTVMGGAGGGAPSDPPTETPTPSGSPT